MSEISCNIFLAGEGKFLGAKCLAVVGQFIAIGESKSTTWSRLNATAQAGQSVVSLRDQVNWNKGDQIVLAPTGYFGKEGHLWSDPSGGVEIHTISSIITSNGGTKLFLNSPLNQTHLCTTVEGEFFCGAVGILTRSIQISSKDSEDKSTSSFGFGGHIAVVDLIEGVDGVSSSFSGSVTLINVNFKNLGQMDSDRYAISFSYSASHMSSVVANCSFTNSYSIAVYASGTNGLRVYNNVAVNLTQGGIFIDSTCNNFTISRNLMIATHQLPSKIISSYPWTTPLASFAIYSPHGIVYSNLAAGSYDQGYMVATEMFFNWGGASPCLMTRGTAYSYNLRAILSRRRFWDNEAVACRGGLFVVNMGPQESSISSCAVVSGIKAWRGGHSGILSQDAVANLLIADVVLAENHIGLSLAYFRVAEDAFSGIVASKVIGSLHESGCADLPDSKWSRICQVSCKVFQYLYV